MKKIVGVMIIVIMFVLAVSSSYSLDIEKGFYAEYRIYEDPEIPGCRAFALFKDTSLDDKYFYFDSLTYKYQILDIQENIADIRICFEGKIRTRAYDEEKNPVYLPFKRIFDITVDLNTLEMIDDNGNVWGKWLFWIKLGSYDKREYEIMKNWNNHGGVEGWLNGPLKNENLSSFLKSSYARTGTHYFLLSAYNEISKTMIYPAFEDYGIITSYKAYKTEEGTIRQELGGYYLDEVEIWFEGETIKMKPGILSEYYYANGGLFFENAFVNYIDDFIDQKLGITLLQMEHLILTDYGMKNEIIIEDPKPEYQTFISDELEKVEELREQYYSYSETPQETETPQSTQEKSETPVPTTTQSNGKDKTNMLYYVVSILTVAIIAIFIVLKEKR